MEYWIDVADYDAEDLLKHMKVRLKYESIYIEIRNKEEDRHAGHITCDKSLSNLNRIRSGR